VLYIYMRCVIHTCDVSYIILCVNMRCVIHKFYVLTCDVLYIHAMCHTCMLYVIHTGNVLYILFILGVYVIRCEMHSYTMRNAEHEQSKWNYRNSSARNVWHKTWWASCVLLQNCSTWNIFVLPCRLCVTCVCVKYFT